MRIASNNGARAADILTVIPDSTADKAVRYSYGRDGVKWVSNDSVPQIYLLDAKRLASLSLLGAAPTEVDIPLGVSIPAGEKMTNDPSSIIFSLPERIAFADYRYVWLIDRQYNRYTNLLEENYEVELEPGTHNQRFALRIGGYPITNEKGQRQYVVFTHEGSLYVRGLIPGDRIDIYSPDGKLLHHAVAGDNEYVRTIGYQTGLVVKVNDQSHKVLAF